MHDCVQCGCACYCHGDIDDCQVETIEYSYMHCDGCGCHEDDFDDGLDYEDEEMHANAVTLAASGNATEQAESK